MGEKINLAEKLAAFDEPWRPKTVARLNDYDVFVVKMKGEFIWHKHDETDDFFLVLKGRATIQLRDRDVELREGELFVVPRGVEHCARADEEADVLLIEPVARRTPGTPGGRERPRTNGSDAEGNAEPRSPAARSRLVLPPTRSSRLARRPYASCEWSRPSAFGAS
jgi:mannose-6-phosphate isomerase-like protein (cupin superfamily)